MATPNIGLDKLVESQARADITVNSSFNLLDCLTQLYVKDRDQNDPTAFSPSDGDVYLVASGATDAWSGHDGSIAFYFSGWYFVTPKRGFKMYVEDEQVLLVFDGSGWKRVPIGTTSTIADLTDSTGGTANDTLQAVGGSYSQTVVANNFADLASKVNSILSALRAAGVIST